MKTFNFNLLTAGKCILFICGAMFFLQSCNPEPVRGCTDVESTNYNSEADEDDGSCAYAEDRFNGTYIGSFGCPTAGIADTMTIVIEPTAGESRDTVMLAITSDFLVGTLNTPAVLSGDDVVINSAGEAEINIPSPETEVDLTMVGTLTFSEADSTLIGNITLNASNTGVGGGVIIANADCPFSGIKQ